MRLDPRFRWTLFGVVGLMFATGAAWLVADWQKSPLGEDFWQASAAWLLVLHGGGAMVTLLVLGALLPVHAYRSWRSRRNRIWGAIMLAVNSVLVATSFGLYYMAGEMLRSWMSNAHIAAGFCLPLFLLVHIALGRRTRPARAGNVGRVE